LTSLVGQARAVAWIEAGDAGRLPATAQWTLGAGPLTSISGVLSDGDVDLFAIQVTDPAAFSATVSSLDLFDTVLFIFDSAGRALLANDDTAASSLSQVPPGSLTATGRYFLGIAAFQALPTNAANQPIFTPPPPLWPAGGVVLPAVADTLVAGWDLHNAGDFGAYEIDLTGAEPAQDVVIPEPSGLLIFAGLIVAAAFWRCPWFRAAK
jgi:hypothetical protein